MTQLLQLPIEACRRMFSGRKYHRVLHGEAATREFNALMQARQMQNANAATINTLALVSQYPAYTFPYFRHEFRNGFNCFWPL